MWEWNAIKNKLNRFNEDKNTPTDKDKDNDKNKDNDNDKTICIINIKDKTKSECKDEDMLIKVYSGEEMKVIKNNCWIRKKLVIVYWNNNTTSELHEKWLFYSDNYVYIRFEELHTCSGESLYNREHKGTLSKKNSSYYIDIDDLYIYIYWWRWWWDHI